MTEGSIRGELVPTNSLPDMQRLAEELVASAAARGVQLTGEGGLLTALTRRVLQSALEVEMAEHLGYDRTTRLAVGRTTRATGRSPGLRAMGINLDGERGIFGMWVGPTGGEGAKQWANMLTELRNRGILDACIVCCDGLRGLPDAILATWPNASAQTCVVHLVRNTLRYASKKVLADHHQTDAADLPRRRSRLPRTQFELAEFAEKWEPTYPAMVAMWRRSWPRVHPVPGVPGRGPQIMFSTNGIESLNARFWAATRRRGHFPDEQSALKVLYLAATQRHKNRTNPTGQIPGWKGILNVLSMTYGNRLGLN